jgi:hypothetical protein
MMFIMIDGLERDQLLMYWRLQNTPLKREWHPIHQEEEVKSIVSFFSVLFITFTYIFI